MCGVRLPRGRVEHDLVELAGPEIEHVRRPIALRSRHGRFKHKVRFQLRLRHAEPLRDLADGDGCDVLLR